MNAAGLPSLAEIDAEIVRRWLAEQRAKGRLPETARPRRLTRRRLARMADRALAAGDVKEAIRLETMRGPR